MQAFYLLFLKECENLGQMKGTQDDSEKPGEIIFASKTLGIYLRLARLRAGFSLRDLEKRSGVSDSEIFQVESGSQECRLASFVRICAALGIPCGHVLDNVVSSNFAPYFKKIMENPSIERLTGDGCEVVRKPLALILAMMASFAAHLVRCSRPSDRAKSTDYPSDQIKASFLQFASSLESEEAPLERLSILKALSDDPIAEMSRLALLDVKAIKSLLQMLVANNKKGDLGERFEHFSGQKLSIPMWTPFLPPEKWMESAYKIKPMVGSKK
jgi:transcriptional regulator with XRE-family HTH domain